MREILFRGKKTGFNEWVQGVVIRPYNDSKLMYSFFDTIANTLWVVDAETVGQYTSLTDRNGKKIFEGDIVTQPVRETRKCSPCLVEFRKGKFQAHHISENRFFDRYYDINSYTKIIGNIHDNPELLKGGVEE